MRPLPTLATLAITSFAVSGPTPLRVLRVTPEQHAPATTVVSVTFDRPVAGSLDASVDAKRLFSIVPAVGGRVEWRDPITLRFTPAEPLKPATEYTVTISSDFAAMDGSRLDAPYRFSFRVRGAVALEGAPAGPNQRAQYLKPDAQFEIVWSTPVELDEVTKRVYIELDRGCAAGPIVRVRAVSQRPITDKDSWRYRAAGGWERDRASDALRRVVRLVPVTPIPKGCRGSLLVPTELDSEGTSAYQRWELATYGPFELIVASCASRPACPTGYTRVQFSTPVRGADIVRGVHFLPRTPFSVRDTSDESATWILEASLKPRTGYAIVVDTAVLRDVFGQQFVGNPVKVFATTGYTPAVSYDYGMILVERAGYRTFPVRHVNVDTLLVTIAPVPDSLEALALQAPPWSLGDVWSRLAPAAKLRPVPVESRRDVPLVSVVRAPVYNAARPGAPALSAMRVAYPGDTGGDSQRRRGAPIALLQTTNLGLTARVGEEEALVWVTGVDDGAPRSGVAVELRDPRGRIRATGTTNVQGLVRLSNFGTDSSAEEFAQHGFAGYVAARLGLDRAVVPINTWSGDLAPWRFNVASAWGSDRLPVAGVVFTERGIYRPGERVYAKAIVRTGALGALRVPVPTDSLRWLFRDREGGVMRDSIVRLSSFGTASQEMSLGSDLPLGTYTVSLQLKRGTWQEIASGSYRVAEYRPPEFLVMVTADSSARFSGDSLNGNVEARYLFGAPMARAAVTWTVNVTPGSAAGLRIPGLDRYYLGESGWWWEEWGSESGRSGVRTVATGIDTLDAAGRITLRVPLSAVEGRPANARFQATVTDVNRQTVSASANVVVHPASFYVAARPLGNDYFWTAGKAQEIAVLVSRPDGRRVSGVRVHGTIVRREWHRVRRARDGVEEQFGEWVADTVARCNLVSADDPVSCKFTPASGGTYIVSFRAVDEVGRTASTSFYRWATGKDWIPWNDESQLKMDLIPDKTRYSVGDTATILVASPFKEAEAWITVEREGLIEQRRLRVTAGAMPLKFRITEAYAPNAFVSMVLVRGRSAPPGGIADPGRPTLRVGYAELRVTPEVKRLAVEVNPEVSEYRPGDSARVRLQVRDATGRGRRSEVTLWAVDEGVLSLTGYKTPDPLDLLYQPRGIGLRLANNLVSIAPQVLETEGASIKGEEQPGGGGGLAGGDILRSRFTATAFFLGSIQTDSSGQATASAKLPDNLTTFRLMALAVTAGDRYGSGESPLLVTRPLLARPALPRFLRPGDEFTAGVVVNQRSGGTPNVTVRARSTGVVQSGPGTRSVTLAPGRGTEVRFAFRDTTADSTAFRFDVASQNDSDAVLVKLPGRPVFTPRAYTVSGSVTDTATAIVTLPGPIDPERSRVVFGIGTTPLAVLAGSYRWLSVYPFECSEQITDELLPLIALYRAGPALQLPDLTPARARAEILKGVAVLSARQRADGGIGLWSADGWTTPWLSAYAGEALLAARDAGLPVRDSVVVRLANFLYRSAHERQLTQVPIATWYSDLRVQLAERVAAADFLSRAGRADLPIENELLRQAAQLSWEDRLRLAQMMARRGARSAARQLIAPIWASVTVEGRRAMLPDSARQTRWFYFPSGQRPIARLLSATLAVDSSHSLIGPLVETLVEQSRVRRWGGWGGGYWNTQDFGVAAAALADFTARQSRAALRGYEVRGNGNQVVFRSRGDSLVREVTRPLTGLLSRGQGDSQRVTLSIRATESAAAGTPPLFFYVTVHEVPRQRPVTPDQQGMQVERWYEDYATGKPVVSVEEGALVRVRLRITVPSERQFVALTDPLPAGLEAVDLSLRTTGELPGPGVATDNQRTETGDEGWEGYAYGWYYGSWDSGWWSPFDHKELRDDRVVYAATVLWKGRYSVTYVARATTPGVFIRPPAHAEEMYNPGVQGRSDGGTFTVRQRNP